MPHILGYSLFAIAALLAGANFYFSFVRPLICSLLGCECPNESGIPLVGTLFLIAALVLLEKSAVLWIGAIVLCAIDTGGPVWFCLALPRIVHRTEEQGPSTFPKRW